MKPLSAALLPLFLAGCFLTKNKDDRPWDAEVVKKIEVGKTTKAELLALLGPPKQIVRLLESEAYQWVHSIEKETGAFMLIVNTQRNDKQYDAITVIVSREGMVSAVGSRFAAEESSYGFPWSD